MAQLVSMDHYCICIKTWLFWCLGHTFQMAVPCSHGFWCAGAFVPPVLLCPGFNGMLSSLEATKLMRHYTLVPWWARSLVTALVVAFLSLLQGSDEIHHVDTFTSKDSLLNQVFVKLGWAWTLAAGTALVLSLLPLSSEPLVTGAKAFARALLLTALFYFWCALVFPTIEYWTGLCLSKNVVMSRHNKSKCLKTGHTFYSFDVSGHAFLMVYCVLTLMQEAQAMRRYISLGQAIASLDSGHGKDDNRTQESLVEHMSGPETSDDGSGEEDRKRISSDNSSTNSSVKFINKDNENGKHSESGSASLDGTSDVTTLLPSRPAADALHVTNAGESWSDPVSAHEAAKFRGVYMAVWPVVCCCYAAVLALCLMWDTMLLITTVYYHSLIEKVLGVIIAVGSWAALYQGLFVKLEIV